MSQTSRRKAYVITGPTSGIGRLTAFEIAKHGVVILVGRDQAKLQQTQKAIGRAGGEAVSVVCDLSVLTSARNAALQIIDLRLPIAGVLNNAGIFPHAATKSAAGIDLAFATNHLGPFVFTETLIPNLEDGTTVVFVASGVEDPERKPAKAVGFRGGRYISAAASARGEWKAEGSKMPGADAYATSKQCNLASMMVLARENPRLRINAYEPGFTPNTGLGGDSGFLLGLVRKHVLPLFAPHLKYWNTPEQAAKIATKVLLNDTKQTGIYYDEQGEPMNASVQVSDPNFASRVVDETREFLGTLSVV